MPTIKKLKEATKSKDHVRKKKEQVKPQPTFADEFRQEYAQLIIDTDRKLKGLFAALDIFNTENGSSIILDPNTLLKEGNLEDALITQRGKLKKRPNIDYRDILRRALQHGYTNTIRLPESQYGDDFVYALLNNDGSVIEARTTYPTLALWQRSVYQRGVDKGTRDNLSGTPYRSVRIQNNNDEWYTLEIADKNSR